MFGIPLHFLVVHFPIALAVAAIIADSRRAHEFGYQLTRWAAVGAVLAVLTGFQMGGSRFESPVSVLHVGSALVGTLSLIVLAVLRYSASAREEDVTENYPATWLLVGALAAAAIAVAVVSGHRFVLGT